MGFSPRARRLVEVACVVALVAAGLAIRTRLHADQWRYAGSDSYGYLKLGCELRAHGRYALGPPPEPLAWARVPGYPLFLALVHPTTDEKASWEALFAAQIALDLVTALLVWLMARRLGGPVAGIVALVLAVLNPFTPPFTAAMLTEVLATCLTTAVAAAILLGGARPLRWWPLAAGLLALSALVRQDGAIVAVAFVPPFVALAAARRHKLRLALVTATVFVLVFAAWPLRNLARFGSPHLASTEIDRFSQPIVHYRGYWSWLRSWAPDWSVQTYPVSCFYDVGCAMSQVHLRGRGAYYDVDDEAEVERLLTLRQQEGLSAAVSSGFEALAAARLRAHPLRVLALHPLTRGWHMWVTSFNELYQGRLPWPSVMRHMRRFSLAWSCAQWLAILLAAAWLLTRRRLQTAAAMLLLPVLVRTAVLAWSFYCMPRYAIEVMPLGWVLVAVAVVEVVTLAIARARALRPHANPVSSEG